MYIRFGPIDLTEIRQRFSIVEKTINNLHGFGSGIKLRKLDDHNSLRH